MNQAFFTLSLGIGAMAIFGSYIGKEHSLLGEAARIWCWIPSWPSRPVSSSSRPASPIGVTDRTGPSLIFMTLPNIFANMAGGPLVGRAVLPVHDLCELLHRAGRV